MHPRGEPTFCAKLLAINVIITSGTINEQTFYDPLIQDNPGEPVLSQRTDLLEQPLDFYNPAVLPAANL